MHGCVAAADDEPWHAFLTNTCTCTGGHKKAAYLLLALPQAARNTGPPPRAQTDMSLPFLPLPPSPHVPLPPSHAAGTPYCFRQWVDAATAPANYNCPTGYKATPVDGYGDLKT